MSNELGILPTFHENLFNYSVQYYLAVLVTVVTRLRAHWPRIWFSISFRCRDVFLLHSVQMVYWVHPYTYTFTKEFVVRSNALGQWHLYEYWVSPHVFISLCLQKCMDITLMLSQATHNSPTGFRRRHSFHSNTLKREGRNYFQILLNVTGFTWLLH